VAIALLATAPVVTAACGGDDTPDASGVDAARLGGSIRVFAAASLTDAFTDVATAFADEHPGVSVELNFGGSSSLREQILGGAPADVFASADESNMDEVVEAGEVEQSATFATNGLQIVVPVGNPAGVTGLEDLARSDLLIGLCAEEVPCGELGRRAFEAADVTPSPDTEEPDVRALLGKVEVGELDAGLVYVTDVVSAGDRVEGIDIPAEVDVVATYPIGRISSSENPAVASAFIEFVLGDTGQAILRDSGFERP
jgi:molybdate transport system substrate-binding protein